jgi:glutamate synthase (NADPH/NADH) small chain
VLVIGGGDTGADCVGTAIRQGAKSVHQFEIMPRPAQWNEPWNPQWPDWPSILRTSSSHEEGCERRWSVCTKAFSGENGRVSRLHAVEVEFGPPDAGGPGPRREIPGSEFEQKADLVLLALGFLHPEHDPLLNGLGVELDARGNAAIAGSSMTSVPGVFAAGDIERGQSLVVWAIAGGRRAAHHIDRYLMGRTFLPA